MFRLLIIALAVALSAASARTEPMKAKIDPAVAAKGGTAPEIAGALAAEGAVRVIVVVEPGAGATIHELATAAREASTRAATKQKIAATVDTVLSRHKLSRMGGAKGAPALVRLTTVPAFSAMVDAAELTALAKDPRVVSIRYDRPMKRQLATTLPLIAAPTIHSLGGTGSGYAVAHIDDGIERDHVFLGLSRLHPGREACFLDTNDCPNGSNQQIGTGAAAAAAGASHGTHTAGIAVGKRASGSPSKGVAPGAMLVPINIFGPNASVSQATILRAFEHVEDLVMEGSGANPLKIASVNMSVGGGLSAGICDDDPEMALLKPVIDSLRSKGVLSVVSAGNDGETGEMSFPGCLSTIVSVAATSRAGVVASYTNISPSTDLFAPGGEVGGDCVISSVPTNSFGGKCGTSMAAPHVAGAIADLRQLFPKASACRIEDALKSTGPLTPDTRSGGAIVKRRLRIDGARSRLLHPVAPKNDNFAAALAIPSNATQYTTEGSNVAATLEAGEPSYVGTSTTRSVWWRWTPLASGPVAIDTLGSGFDTVLAVYKGAASAADLGTRVAVSDNMSATVKQSRVAFSAVAGETYHIAVAGRSASQECAIQLNLKRPPANDHFAQAREVNVSMNAETGYSGTNIGATKQSGEPNLNGDAANTTTVWFRFEAPASGLITIDTLGSPTLADTVLAVYTGAAVNALTLVAVNDDIPNAGVTLSRVTFSMKAGTTYHVQLGGWHGAEGRYRLWFSPAGAQSLERAQVTSVE
jgi:serine protease